MSAWKCTKHYFAEHKFILVSGILIIMLVTVLSLIPPQLLRYVVDDILEGGKQKKLLVFALLYTGAYLLLGLVSIAKEIVLVRISQGISKELRISMMKHIGRLTFLNFTKYDSASLEAYFNNDVSAINRLITSGVVSMSIDIFKMLGIIISIFVFSRSFGLVILCVVPLLAFYAMYVRKRMFAANLKRRNLEGEVNHLIYENVENISAVKLYDTNFYTGKKYNRILDRLFHVSQTANLYDAMFPVVMVCVENLVIAALILLSGLRGEVFGLSVGVVVAMITLIKDLFEPISNLGMELQTIQTSLAGITRVNQFFALERDEEKLENVIIGREGPVLEFTDVCFSYDGEEEVISHFSCLLEGTEKLALQGRSGAGKSTLFKLAYGLLKPTSGRVTLNGCDTYLLSEESRRGLFGIVYQEPFFSGESLYEELTLHRNIPEQKVFEALEMVGLSRITDLAVKFEASDYSTGELSLFNIARVILLDCRVLFLDEMNARIDPATAVAIMDVMNRIAQNKMVLSINHYGNLLENTRILTLN